MFIIKAPLSILTVTVVCHLNFSQCCNEDNVNANDTPSIRCSQRDKQVQLRGGGEGGGCAHEFAHELTHTLVHSDPALTWWVCG